MARTLTCGHKSAEWAEVKKYDSGRIVEHETVCPQCYYFSCFCHVELTKQRNISAYNKFQEKAKECVAERASERANKGRK